MERRIDIKNNKYAIVAAARNGHLNILKQLNEFEWDEETFNVAVMEGQH